MIRPATIRDLDVLFELALKECGRYPLRPDHQKIRSGIEMVISERRHAALVVEREGQVVGALLAATQDNLWAQRCSCQVLFWVCPVPGEGAEMLRRFLKWVRGRQTSIKVAGFMPDHDIDPRVWLLVERAGFKKHGGAYLLYT